MAEWWEEGELVDQPTDGEWWADSPIAGDPGEKEPPTPDEVPWYEEAAMDMGKSYLGRGEAALTMLSGAVAEPIAGLAGLGAAVFDGAEAGAEAVEGTKEALTYQPRLEEGRESLQTVGQVLQPVGEALSYVEEGLGENVLEATGSPALAAAAHSVPTALMEVMGLASLKSTSKAAKNARKATDERLDAEGLADAIEPEARTMEEITADLRKKNTPRVVEDIKPDLDLKKRAEELGIELNPSHYSTNEAYRKVEQTIKELPDSKLFAKESEAISKLVREGDELITDMDGNLNRSLLEEDLRERMGGTIKGLEDKAELAYREVNGFIPPATKINPNTSAMYINQRLSELGGDLSLLSAPERKLYNVLNRTKKPKKGSKAPPEIIAPTYNALDTLRRDISAGYKRKGVFKDADTGQLDQVYAVLSKDQHNAAKAMNMGDEFAAAQKLVQTRKNVEKRGEILFGRQMQKDFLPKLSSAATAMSKGQHRQLRELMEALPEDMRQRAAATMLNDIFTMGQRNKTGIGDGFANAYSMMERNGGLDEVFKYLPENQRRRFESIGKISRGITRARKFENKSGSGRVVMKGLQDGTLVERIISSVATGAINVMAWKTAGHFGASAADRAVKSVKDLSKKEKMVDELLASNDMRRALDLAMENRVAEADILLKRSKAWQAWRDAIGEGNKKQLAAMGPIAWLTQQDQQQPQQPQQEQQPGGQ